MDELEVVRLKMQLEEYGKIEIHYTPVECQWYVKVVTHIYSISSLPNISLIIAMGNLLTILESNKNSLLVLLVPKEV